MSAKKRKLRTWSEFGDIRRRPTEYEIGAHAANYTVRRDRMAPLEQNPSSPGNLWFLAYRDNSPLQLDDWEVYRDPDQLTYRAYVAKQAAQETKVAGLMDSYSNIGHDQSLSPGWVGILRTFYTPIRYPAHALQMLQAYVAHMSPTAYITNAASLSMADQLRRVTVVSIRTRELQLGYPDAGFATGERDVWEGHDGWQPTRELLERALIAYDWGEALTAANLVIAPTLDDVLNRQLGDVARANGDDLTWLLCQNLHEDSARRARWSSAVASLAVEGRAENKPAFESWIAKWAPRADAAALALGGILAGAPNGDVDAETVAAEAAEARQQVLAVAGLGEPALQSTG
ncbi:MAG: toluene hydroxylase [bacterium]|nr:toluene hydroxylase [bacterium]